MILAGAVESCNAINLRDMGMNPVEVIRTWDDIFHRMIRVLTLP